MPLPLILAAAGAVGSGVTGAIQASKGRKQAEEAQREIDAFSRQTLTNYADNLSVRTETSDFQAEEADQSLSNTLDVISQGGSFENATGLANQAIKAKNRISQGLEQQRSRIDQARLSENQNIRGIQESRDQADLAGLGAKLQYGNQQRAQGQAAIGSAFNSLTKAAAGGLGGGLGAASGGASAAGSVSSQITPQSIQGATSTGEGAYQSPLTTKQQFNNLPIFGGNRNLAPILNA